MIVITILYAFLGWLVALAINHAANLLPKRESVLQWPHHTNNDPSRRLTDWSVFLTKFSQDSEVLSHWPRKIIIRSMIIELITPLFFLFLLFYFGLTWRLALATLYTAILILITVTDLEHRLIFNAITFPAIMFGIVAAFFSPHLPWRAALLGGGTAFITTYLIWLLGALLYGHGALGSGDITLATFLGLILGFPQIILTVLFTVFLGAFVAVILLITRQVNRKSFIPYGPFLTITGWIMLVWGHEITQYYFW